MSIWSIGAIILFGILLVMAETFLVAGSLVAGIAGGILLICGIILAFTYLGTAIGSLVLIASILITFILMFISAKIMARKDFGLQTALDGKVNEIDALMVQIGDEGEAFGDLRLNGRARINGELFDVESVKSYIDSGTIIKVVAIEGSKIMVEATSFRSEQLSVKQTDM